MRRIAITTLFVAGCSLLTETSGFSSGKDVEPTPIPDGGGAIDGSSATDGSGDGPAIVAPNKSFSCADHPTAAFCTDFNTPPVDHSWTSLYKCDDCTMELDPSTSVSLPSSFRSVKPAHTSGNHYAALYKEFDRFTTAHIELDIRFDKIVESGLSLSVFYFCFRNDTAGCGGYGGFNLALEREGLVIEEEAMDVDSGGRIYRSHPFQSPTLPKFRDWVHVVFDFSIEADTSKISVQLDGVEKMKGGSVDLLFHTFANDPKVLPALNVGIFYADPSGPHEVWIDNLLVETK